MPSQQTVEKLEFAREASFYYPFFATGFPGQKTLLSAQVCECSAEKPLRGFFDGITGGQLLPSRFVYSIMIIFPVMSVVYSIFGLRRQYPLESLSAVHSM